MAGQDAMRALALVGVPFRSQGRDPAQGLDCVGLALSACGLPSDMVRNDYRLRGAYLGEIRAVLRAGFRPVSARQRRPGDLLLIKVADDQLHLAVLTGDGFVHADARLRRVVETPGEPGWPIVGIYRRRRSMRK
jgi:murein DD-endopeptidase / murein LD-carboxypeptidase